MATSSQIPEAQAKPIQAQIAAIQSGINKLKGNASDFPTPKPSNNLKDYRDALGNQVLYPVNPDGTQTINGQIFNPNSVESSPAQTTQATTDPTSSQYTVKPGDTLSGIAKAQGVDMSAISGYKSGDPNKIGVGETLTIAQQYQKAHELAKQSGVPAAQGAGAGYSGAQQFMNATQGPREEAPSILGGVMDVDSNFDSILTMYDDLMSPVKQKQSLLEEYKAMESSLGITGMNAELIDAKRIIEGTEDDIRNEVTAAGGFATDSQVLALANARNKSLIKNYNYLLEARNNAQTQLQTMMNLSIQDRQFAEAEFDRKMNFAFKVAEFKQKAVDNARSGLQSFITNVTALGGNGYEALFKAAQSPYEVGLIEKTLGMPSGSLAQSASLAGKTDTQIVKLDNGRTILVNSRTGETIRDLGGQKPNDGNGNVSPYQTERATRTLQSVAELSIAVKDNPGIFGRTAALPLPGFLRSDAYRNFKTNLDTLKASIAFGELQAMREASKTGGALGSVANQELQLLESALAGLEMSQTSDSFTTNLNKVRDSINRWNSAQGGSQLPITAPDGSQVIIVD